MSIFKLKGPISRDFALELIVPCIARYLHENSKDFQCSRDLSFKTLFFSNRLSTPSSRTHERLSELMRQLSASLRTLLPELQKNTVRCAALSMKVIGHRQEQLTQTLIVRLLMKHFFDCEKSTEQNRVSDLSDWLVIFHKEFTLLVKSMGDLIGEIPAHQQQ